MSAIRKRTVHAIILAFILAVFMPEARNAAAQEGTAGSGASVAGHIPRPASEIPHSCLGDHEARH